MNRYIVNRLIQPSHNPSLITKWSTPVLGFGDYYRASVSTVGLNPSFREFNNHNGLLLSPKNRLETLKTLNIQNISHALPYQLQLIECACLQYFNKNPCKSWFNKFNPILNVLSASYYNGEACHLDLVQSTTYEFIKGAISLACTESSAPRSFCVMGWSINIQSSHGVTTQLIQDIAAKCV